MHSQPDFNSRRQHISQQRPSQHRRSFPSSSSSSSALPPCTGSPQAVSRGLYKKGGRGVPSPLISHHHTTADSSPQQTREAFFSSIQLNAKSPSDQIRSSNHGPLTGSRRRHQGAIHQRQRDQRHGRRRPQDQDPGAERADPVLHHAPVRGGAPVARPGDRPGRADHLQLRDRDPQGQQGQVRAGQEDGAHQGGPRALLLGGLPAQLRLHPAHPLRRLRPHRRPRHHAGARRARMLPPRQGHRPHAHDRPGRGRRQDHRRLRRRPRVPPLQRHQGAASPPPRRDQAILRGLQEEREQGGGRQRLPAVGGRLRGHPALHGSLCHLHLRGPEEVDDRSGDAMPLAAGSMLTKNYSCRGRYLAHISHITCIHSCFVLPTCIHTHTY